MKKITISAQDVSVSAELNDSDTAQKIWDALPFESKINTWGDEIYFDIPVDIEQEPDARTDVEVGALGYWPPGHAFCIFFGSTPASNDNTPQAAGPVNIFGRVSGDATVFRRIGEGVVVRVEELSKGQISSG